MDFLFFGGGVKTDQKLTLTTDLETSEQGSTDQRVTSV